MVTRKEKSSLREKGDIRGWYMPTTRGRPKGTKKKASRVYEPAPLVDPKLHVSSKKRKKAQRSKQLEKRVKLDYTQPDAKAELERLVEAKINGIDVDLSLQIIIPKRTLQRAVAKRREEMAKESRKKKPTDAPETEESEKACRALTTQEDRMILGTAIRNRDLANNGS